MNLRALWVALVNQLTKRAIRAGRDKAKPGRHRLGAHDESVHIWSLFETLFGLETSQELHENAIADRGNRSRVNGFVTVKMLVGGKGKLA